MEIRHRETVILATDFPSLVEWSLPWSNGIETSWVSR